MSDITANLIVLAVIGSLIGLLFLYLRMRKKKKQTLLLDFAREKGWQAQVISEPLTSGLRISGSRPKGNWTLESVARSSGTDAGPGSSNVILLTNWWSNSIEKSNISIVLGPRFSSQVGTSFLARGNPLRDATLRLLLGDSASWISTLEAVDAAAFGLGDHFLMLTDRPEEVGTFLKSNLVEALNKFPRSIQPVIIFGNCRLEMRLNNVRLQEPSELESFINLGSALIENWCQ